MDQIDLWLAAMPLGLYLVGFGIGVLAVCLILPPLLRIVAQWRRWSALCQPKPPVIVRFQRRQAEGRIVMPKRFVVDHLRELK
jgi:hypothetical protein